MQVKHQPIDAFSLAKGGFMPRLWFHIEDSVLKFGRDAFGPVGREFR